MPTAAQLDALLAAMPRKADRLLVRFAAQGGTRWGETIGLRVSDLDLERRTARVFEQLAEDDSGRIERRGPKSKYSRRTVVLPSDLVAGLREHVAGLAPDDLVFTSPQGKPLRRSNWNRRHWRPAHRAAGWPAELSFHNLRHSAGMNWARSELDIRDASRMLGHSSPRFTEARYVRSDADYVERARKVIA